MNNQQTFTISNYTRLEYEGIPIYVYSEFPDWFIPSRRSDTIIQSLLNERSLLETAQADSTTYGQTVGQSLFLIEKFLSRFKYLDSSLYTGRGDKHTLKDLKECWFHVTNRCNLSCSHCMFSSCPSETAGLGKKEIIYSVHEALSLGCRVFYFTGGEPFIFNDFTLICDEVFKEPDAHVVILSNGLTIPKYKSWLSRIDKERIHIQVSIDGQRELHDNLRGEGTFDRVMNSLQLLSDMRCNCTLAMSVLAQNLKDMDCIVDIAASHDIHNIHYLWFFRKGKGKNQNIPSPDSIVESLLRAKKKADEHDVLIDNIEIIKSQVFSLPGTRFDLSNAGWQSLAVGPDGRIYPSPAMVGEKNMAAGHIREGIEKVWKESAVFENVRKASIIDDEHYKRNPLRFLIGGGDIDHSFIQYGKPTGHDPYTEVYNRIALYVLAEEAKEYTSHKRVTMFARMGERLYECSEDMGHCAFTHSNCVLSLPGKDGHTLVKSFYSAAAEKPNLDILNPVHYDERDISHVPKESRVRSYGCGSPVLDCDLKPGETVVDLGSGAGVECFIAAKKVGHGGKVIGIDMAEPMLSIARQSSRKVSDNLTYDVIDFRKAFLEQLPVDTNSVDVVISNCVINLSPDKRKTFYEIFRILKPGGRIMISDIAYDEDIPLDIKYNEKLRGECIGGSFREDELFAMLYDINFEAAQVIKRFLYREVQGYKFYSITYSARKPAEGKKLQVVYRGPFAAIVTDSGEVLTRGVKTEVELTDGFPLDDSIFVIDKNGQVTNVEQNITCSCYEPQSHNQKKSQKPLKNTVGCMVCGAEIVYAQGNKKMSCHYCGAEIYGNAACTNGHFVCDNCHAQDALSLIKTVCFSATEKDMISLMKKIRGHASFPMHGPEHHSLVPGIVLTAYRNSGGVLSNNEIVMGVERGTDVPGGACAFMGTCGAAVGVGIAFSIIRKSNPLKGKERQDLQKVTSKILNAIAEFKAARCCQRECYIALREAARLSESYIGLKLIADEPLSCTQHIRNKECIKKACPLWQEDN